MCYDKASIVYDIGKWCEPPRWLSQMGLGICTFEELLFARQFTDTAYMFPPDGNISAADPTFPIFEVEADGEIFPLPTFASIESLDHFGWFHPLPKANWPEGTRMFRRVKLLREVFT
jgi:hypothetical protein